MRYIIAIVLSLGAGPSQADSYDKALCGRNAEKSAIYYFNHRFKLKLQGGTQGQYSVLVNKSSRRVEYVLASVQPMKAPHEKTLTYLYVAPHKSASPKGAIVVMDIDTCKAGGFAVPKWLK